MSINDWYPQYLGQHLFDNHDHYWGECVSFVKRYAQEAQAVPDADSALYVKGDLAKNMFLDPTDETLQYYDREGSPQPGDIVVYDGSYGDVAVYIGNNRVVGQLGFPVYGPAAVRNLGSGVLGYLRRKGEDMTPNFGDIDNVYLQDNGRVATDAEKEAYSKIPWSDPTGLYYGKVRVDFENLQKALKEAQQNNGKVLQPGKYVVD